MYVYIDRDGIMGESELPPTDLDQLLIDRGELIVLHSDFKISQFPEWDLPEATVVSCTEGSYHFNESRVRFGRHHGNSPVEVVR